jgi:hypothetical protein
MKDEEIPEFVSASAVTEAFSGPGLNRDVPASVQRSVEPGEKVRGAIYQQFVRPNGPLVRVTPKRRSTARTTSEDCREFIKKSWFSVFDDHFQHQPLDIRPSPAPLRHLMNAKLFNVFYIDFLLADIVNSVDANGPIEDSIGQVVTSNCIRIPRKPVGRSRRSIILGSTVGQESWRSAVHVEGERNGVRITRPGYLYDPPPQPASEVMPVDLADWIDLAAFHLQLIENLTGAAILRAVQKSQGGD